MMKVAITNQSRLRLLAPGNVGAILISCVSYCRIKEIKVETKQIINSVFAWFSQKMGPNTFFGGRNRYLISGKQKRFFAKKA